MTHTEQFRAAYIRDNSNWNFHDWALNIRTRWTDTLTRVDPRFTLTPTDIHNNCFCEGAD